MKQNLSTKRVIIAAFIISLLFHAGSILFVVVERTNQGNSDLIPENHEQLPEQIRKKQEEWAEAKARANNFGAPVMFEDLPEDTQEPEESTEELEPDTKPDEKIAQETEQQIIPETVPEKITPKEKSISFDTPAQEKKAPAQKKPLPEKPLQQKQLPEQKKIIPEKKINRPKPPLSLAQLTQGFLNHVKDEGKHAVHMLGKKNGTPSDEQIKYERYLQKLSWCLQNSFNINNNRIPASAITESTVYILLSLNKDGTLRNCNITKTSGNAQLDQFTLFIFNDASTSFPPVPTYLPHDPFTITYIISHNTREQNGMRLYRQ